MNFIQKIKSLLAKGETEKTIGELYSYMKKNESSFENEVILLSGEYQLWKRDFRLGLKPKRKILNRINLALVEIIDLIDGREYLNPNNDSNWMDSFTILYDSRNEKDKNSWSAYNSGGLFSHPESVQILMHETDGNIFRLKAKQKEFVGMEKSINRLTGIVELEYRAIASGFKEGWNLMFQLIPMKQTGPDQTGYIEVGSNYMDDPDNPVSPFRKRYFIPENHIGDQQWHYMKLDFDFRYLKEAYYSIFAPRINEGARKQGSGEMEFRKVRIYG